jgi:hypothetical protein
MLNINIILVYPSDAPISGIRRLNMADLEVLITVITPESGGDVARQKTTVMFPPTTLPVKHRGRRLDRSKQYNTYVTASYGILTVQGSCNCTWHPDDRRDKCTSIWIYKVYFISL